MVLADALSQPHRSYFHWIVVFFSGMCMGAADIVPGISGGTVAFIIGIYPELLQSLNSFNTNTLKLLMSFKIKEAANSVGWKFLLVLLSGISLSFFTLAQFFSDILVHEVYRVYLYSAFFGLILASMWFCSRLLDRWQARHAVIFFIGVLIAYGLTNVHFSVKNDQPLYKVAVDIKKPDMAVDNYSDGMLLHVHAETLSAMLSKEIIKSDAAVVNESTGTSGMAKDFAFYPSDKVLDPWIIGCGAIAISAMLLPGISGSYLLTILGVYGVVIAALADFIRGAKAGIFESEAFYILASMMIGIVIGALAFSRVVAW
jgi:putative membrane protein